MQLNKRCHMKALIVRLMFATCVLGFGVRVEARDFSRHCGGTFGPAPAWAGRQAFAPRPSVCGRRGRPDVDRHGTPRRAVRQRDRGLVPSCRNLRTAGSQNRLLTRAVQKGFLNRDRKGAAHANFRNLVLVGPPIMAAPHGSVTQD